MLVVLARALLFVDASGPTPVLLAQAALTGAAPLLLAGPVAGFLADRWPRRQILVTGQTIRAALALCAAMSVTMKWQGVTLGIFIACLCATRVLFTARVASVRHLVRQHELVAADSLMLIVGVAAATVGAALFGASMVVSPGGQLVVVAAGHFGAAYAFDRVRTWLGGEGETTSIRWRAVVGQLTCGKTRYAVLSTSFHRLLVGAIVATVALDVDGRTGGSASGYALTLGISGVAAFLGSVSSEWINEHVPRRSLTVMAFAIAACGVGPLAFIPGAAPRLAVVGLVVFLFQNLRVASDATIQANAAPGSCGRVFAAYDIAFNLAYVVGLLVGLGLATNLSVETAFMTTGPAYLVGAVGFAILSRVSVEPARREAIPNNPPPDESEGVEDARHDDEGTGGPAVPNEVA